MRRRILTKYLFSTCGARPGKRPALAQVVKSPLHRPVAVARETHEGVLAGHAAAAALKRGRRGVSFRDVPEAHRARCARAHPGTLSHVLHVRYSRDYQNPYPPERRNVGTKKSWLEVLKETIEEKPRLPREDSEKSKTTTVQNVQKVRKAEHEAGGEVVDLDVARTLRSEDECSLLAAGWSATECMGLTIWANPKTGFYCSQEVALYRLGQGESAGGSQVPTMRERRRSST